MTAISEVKEMYTRFRRLDVEKGIMIMIINSNNINNRHFLSTVAQLSRKPISITLNSPTPRHVLM